MRTVERRLLQPAGRVPSSEAENEDPSKRRGVLVFRAQAGPSGARRVHSPADRCECSVVVMVHIRRRVHTGNTVQSGTLPLRQPLRESTMRDIADRSDVRNRVAVDEPAPVNNVTTVRIGNRLHYVHPENGRTLCGRLGGVSAAGYAQCVRCEQILQQVDTSLLLR